MSKKSTQNNKDTSEIINSIIGINIVYSNNMEQTLEKTVAETKIQLTCFDIIGKVYLQRFYKTIKSAYSAHKRASKKYGAYLRFETKPVPKDQRGFTSTPPVGSQYCFCPNTSLAVNRCPDCGKSPYTD